jgi:hypothetical protein
MSIVRRIFEWRNGGFRIAGSPTPHFSLSFGCQCALHFAPRRVIITAKLRCR